MRIQETKWVAVQLCTVGALACLGCDTPKKTTEADASEPNSHQPVQRADTWSDLVTTHLESRYGEPGMGSANQDADAIVRYVARYPAEDHIVYVTSGASTHRFPHEFVMRIKLKAPTSKNLATRAPAWPDVVLAEIAQVEQRTGRVFVSGDYLSNMQFEGVPYRHFVFVKDPVLEPLHDSSGEPLFFVQVIPLRDSQHADLVAYPDGEKIEFLESWSRRDPLFLVDAEQVPKKTK